MNFKATLKRSIKLNERSYKTYILTGSISIMIFFMYSTLIYNEAIRNGTTNKFIMFEVEASMATVVNIICFFIVYVYTTFIKSRGKEIYVLNTIGITSKEVRKIIIMENSILISICFIIGLILGSAFSKLFFMIVMKVLGIKNFKFNLGIVNYIVTIKFFLFLFVILIIWTIRITQKLKVDKIPVLKEQQNGIIKKNRYVGFILLIIAAELTYNNMTKYFEPSLWYYAANVFTSIFLVCMIIYIVYKNMIKCAKISKRVYYSKFLYFREFHRLIRKDSFIVIGLSTLSFLLISYKRIFDHYNSSYNANTLDLRQRVFIAFIYTVTVVIFFAMSSNIIYFRNKMDIGYWRSLYKKLFMIGITEKEMKRIINYRLIYIFFAPILLSLFMSIIYIFLTRLKVEFLIITLDIELLYFIIELCGYAAAKKTIYQEVLNNYLHKI